MRQLKAKDDFVPSRCIAEYFMDPQIFYPLNKLKI
jgi:hypothetical protein